MQAHQSATQAVELFRERLSSLESEAIAIGKQLGRQDLVELSHRTEDLVRRTKSLLDGNTTVLFSDEPDLPERLYRHLGYAQGHVEKALSEEFEFEKIKQRLFMATSLAEYVLSMIGPAVERL